MGRLSARVELRCAGHGDGQARLHFVARACMMLKRLMGLETEYATLVRSPVDQASAPTRREVYEAVCAEVALRMPTARGRYDADTLFLANGGALSLESSPARHDQPGGLIEGATPETTSPSRLVECQRAQDQLIAEAASSCAIPGTVRIFKNSCDAHGHVYGCQENYSAVVARGPWLLIYWCMMGMVLPLAMVYWGACLGVLALELGLVLGVRCLRLGWGRVWSGRGIVRDEEVWGGADGPDVDSASNDTGDNAGERPPVPMVMLRGTAWVLRLVNLPTALLLQWIATSIAFRRQRKYLTAFLVSRVVVTGAGHVDRDNRYQLSSKAMVTNSVTGVGSYFSQRPVFVFQHWLQQVCGRSLLSVRAFAQLFHRRQRLQIALSDSNVSDTAEFLKVGVTALVLDMIEAGRVERLPKLRRPIRALHQIASDWNLVTRVETDQGDMSGLDIQRRYLKACQGFVASAELAEDHEAHEVMRRWEAALDALGVFRSSAVDPRPALGHIDWLTKKWMLDRLDERAAELDRSQNDATCAQPPRDKMQRWAARKKVDIRYHELCEDGYFARLRGASPEVCSVDPAGIDAALRLPPSGSPASRRGQLIREFADGKEQVAVDWSHVVIGTGKDRRVVSLD